MSQSGDEFSQRHQDEATVGHSRMRNFYLLGADHARAVEKNIEVDDARAARDDFSASEKALDSLQRMEQRLRGQ